MPESDKNRKITFLIFILISLIYALPLLKNINNWGQMDWDQFTFWYSLPRKIIFEFHQFPLWNPYSNGGNVYLAHPHSAFLSPAYIFVLIFGGLLGLKISWVFHLFFGMLGMFFLSRHLGILKISAYLAAIIFMFCSMFTLHLSEGHIDWLGLAYLPWFFLYLLRSKESRKNLVLAVVFFAFMILAASIDVLMVAGIFTGIYAILKSAQKRKLLFLRNSVLIVLTAITLSSIKLVPMFEFLERNPRKTVVEGSTDSALLSQVLFSRDQAFYYQETKWAWPEGKVKVRGRDFDIGWHEYGAYVGFLPCILAIFGAFFYFKRYWPLLITGILLLWVSMGGAAILNLWELIHKLPVYDSLQVPSRFILGFVFCLSLFAGFGLSKIEEANNKKWQQVLLGIIVSFVFLDLFLVDRPLLSNVFTIKPPEIKKHAEFKQRYRDLILFPGESRSSMCFTLSSNSGIINSYEVVNVKAGKIAAEGENDYRGEAYLSGNNGEINLIKHTPGYIEVQVNALKPDLLVVNQNFYPGWKVKGLESSKAEPDKGLISAKVPVGKYKVVFYYFPDSFVIGLALTVLALAGLIIFLLKK